MGSKTSESFQFQTSVVPMFNKGWLLWGNKWGRTPTMQRIGLVPELKAMSTRWSFPQTFKLWVIPPVVYTYSKSLYFLFHQIWHTGNHYEPIMMSEEITEGWNTNLSAPHSGQKVIQSSYNIQDKRTWGRSTCSVKGIFQSYVPLRSAVQTLELMWGSW